jgi:hypothetical protein
VDADLFAIRGGHLVVSNIKLRHAENIESWALISNIGSGTVEVKDGVILTGDEEAPNSDGVYLEGGTFTMSGGEISGLRYGIILNGNGTELIISGGTISNNGNNDSGNGVIVLGNGNTLTISGGTFEDNGLCGVWIEGSDNIVTVSNGNFEGNGYAGVSIQGTGNSVTISGGEIKDNSTHGVDIQGTGNSITISGGEIKNNNNGAGISFWEATDCTLTIEDKAVISNNLYGIGVWTENSNNNTITIIMSGGEIKDNESDWCAVAIMGENCNFIMKGGIISGNAGRGIIFDGSSGSGFEKTGGVIYGNDAGDNSNAGGAISLLYKVELNRTIEETEQLAAKINADGDDIESKEGNWD